MSTPSFNVSRMPAICSSHSGCSYSKDKYNPRTPRTQRGRFILPNLAETHKAACPARILQVRNG